jgi:hypothetical protein
MGSKARATVICAVALTVALGITACMHWLTVAPPPPKPQIHLRTLPSTTGANWTNRGRYPSESAVPAELSGYQCNLACPGSSGACCCERCMPFASRRLNRGLVDRSTVCGMRVVVLLPRGALHGKCITGSGGPSASGGSGACRLPRQWQLRSRGQYRVHRSSNQVPPADPLSRSEAREFAAD